MAEAALIQWADELEAACAACPGLGLSGVRVVAETASTQDAAWAACAGKPGWLVVAGRQVDGRGRLGRVWADTGGKGLAMTLALPAGRVSSVGAGVGVCRAVAGMVGEGAVVGLRWPNDVVARACGRKIAGVLVEVRDGVSLVGIGVNVGQVGDDYPEALRERAVSVAGLGGAADRLGVACAIVRELERVVQMDAHAVAREAVLLDTVVGTRRRFRHDGREYAGEVIGIGDDGAIDLATADGVVSLPAGTTSMVHE